jgi:hypothetical protein
VKRRRNAIELSGTIASCGFASGHRLVVGAWRRGPLGPMNDVMCVDPHGVRTLFAPNNAIAEFVSAIYRFEHVDVIPDLSVIVSPNDVTVLSSTLKMRMYGGRIFPIPLASVRTPVITRFVEGPIARRTMGVRTFGVTATGIHEWYRAHEYRRVISASAALHGVDLGAMAPLAPELHVGFSEPPRRPSIVRVSPLLWDPTGTLNKLLQRVS